MKAEISEHQVTLIAETEFERQALTKITTSSIQSIRDKSSEDWSESKNRGKSIVITLRDPNKW